MAFARSSGSVSNDARAILEGCRRIELAMAQFYDQMADVHRGLPAIARLWRKTEREEHAHANHFGFALENWRDLVVRVNLDMKLVDQTERAINILFEECAVRDPTVEEALMVAVRFEEQMANMHMESIAVFSDPGAVKLFRAMMAADRAHIHALQAALVPSTPAPVVLLRPSRTNRK